MLKIALLTFLFTAASALHARKPESPPDLRHIRELSEDPARQGRLLLRFDYPKQLERALAKKPEGLRELFRFTDTEAFVGAGAECHAAILRDLLRYCGDDLFATVLRSENRKVRKAVIGALDYTWPHPGWQPTEYPATYRISKHQTIQAIAR